MVSSEGSEGMEFFFDIQDCEKSPQPFSGDAWCLSWTHATFWCRFAGPNAYSSLQQNGTKRIPENSPFLDERM